jgi:hypothetical protein
MADNASDDLSPQKFRELKEKYKGSTFLELHQILPFLPELVRNILIQKRGGKGGVLTWDDLKRIFNVKESQTAIGKLNNYFESSGVVPAVPKPMAEDPNIMATREETPEQQTAIGKLNNYFESSGVVPAVPKPMAAREGTPEQQTAIGKLNNYFESSGVVPAVPKPMAEVPEIASAEFSRAPGGPSQLANSNFNSW